ncbi:hypothetical protein EZV62_018067 [Acer yangbiense]|uniref:DUF4283 domain-containing protein n=1 Tax=Acer yangbiense TaxID=1000413 RepID=A0A5C7HIR3_9ROSI|nr:hypothetical protein EZV62_018067 [Acer yangbiense]
MVDSDIAKLYENLSLADEDEAVLEMAEEVKTDGIGDIDKCLVGKVLTGKKVNRDAFKGVIEQIWNAYGHVEMELVRDNTFMFYFNNSVDRNRVWNKGPWHFGRSLITLEKPVGSGDIEKLGFDRADFWVQIHDIQILCMNRRTAKWLAEQLGEVVEIPSESRECWGKFMRVKVRLDISKPLKRWLRLKLGKSEEVTMVGLKYERLPEFYFACGRIGHGIMECTDEEARKMALEVTPTKFGSWMKASRSLEVSREDEGDGSVSVKPGSISAYLDSSNLVASRSMLKEKNQGTLISVIGGGLSKIDEMVVDGLDVGPMEGEQEKAHHGRALSKSQQKEKESQAVVESICPMIEAQPNQTLLHSSASSQHQVQQSEIPKFHSPPKQKSNRKWKKTVRESHLRQSLIRISSPLHRLLAVSKSGKKPGRSKNSPPSAVKSASGKKKEKSPLKLISSSHVSPSQRRETPSIKSTGEGQMCKPKVSEEGLAAVVKGFFSSLFKSSSPSVFDFQKATEGISPRLSEN